MNTIDKAKIDDFQKEIERLINRYSLDNDLHTPDFIIAEYLVSCLETLRNAVIRREIWDGEIEEVIINHS